MFSLALSFSLGLIASYLWFNNYNWDRYTRICGKLLGSALTFLITFIVSIIVMVFVHYVGLWSIIPVVTGIAIVAYHYKDLFKSSDKQ